MEGLALSSIVRHNVINCINREELLLIKYEEYSKTIKDNDLNELLVEFKDTSREHIEILKNKLERLDTQ